MTWRERVVLGCGIVFFEVRRYMTAHCVAPQQSLMMAAPDFVMDGLLGGVSNVCVLGFGESWRRKKGGRWPHWRCKTALALSDSLFFVTHSVRLWAASPKASASVWGTRPSLCPPPAPCVQHKTRPIQPASDNWKLMLLFCYSLRSKRVQAPSTWLASTGFMCRSCAWARRAFW